MPNLVNRLIAAEYDGVLGKSEGVLIMSLGRVTVKELEKLRNQLAKEGVRLRMVRNSLIRRVFAERGFELDGKMLEGNSGVAFGSIEGTIHCAKVMTSAKIKKAGKLQLRGAIFDGQLLSAGDAVALAGLPDKKTLRAQLVGCIQGPLRGLVTTLNALPSGVARVLQAHADQAPPATEAAAATEAPAS